LLSLFPQYRVYRTLAHIMIDGCANTVKNAQSYRSMAGTGLRVFQSFRVICCHLEGMWRMETRP
jgi:hypothetical protein